MEMLKRLNEISFTVLSNYNEQFKMTRKPKKSYILDLIKVWPQFIHYILINDIASFSELIALSQTCRVFRNYFNSNFKPYNILCRHQYYALIFKKDPCLVENNLCTNTLFTHEIPTYGVFKHIEMFYSNEFEKKIFQRIFDSVKEKPTIDEAGVGYIMVLDWYREYGCKKHDIEFSYSYVIDLASSLGKIEVLDWFLKYELEEHADRPPKLAYSMQAINGAADQNHVNVLNWFLKQYLTYKLPLKYSSDVLDNASLRGYIDVLNWFLENHLKHGIPFVYSDFAVRYASLKGRVDVLNWWMQTCINHNFPFKYNNLFIEEAIDKKIIKSIKWWHFEFQFSRLNQSFDYFYTPKYIACIDAIFKNKKPADEKRPKINFTIDNYEKENSCGII